MSPATQPSLAVALKGRKKGGEKHTHTQKSRSLTISLHSKYPVTINHPELESNKYSFCPTVSWTIIAFKNKSHALEAAYTRIYPDTFRRPNFSPVSSLSSSSAPWESCRGNSDSHICNLSAVLSYMPDLESKPKIYFSMIHG